MHRWCALNITWTLRIFIAGWRIFTGTMCNTQPKNQHITCVFLMLDMNHLAAYLVTSCVHLIPLEGDRGSRYNMSLWLDEIVTYYRARLYLNGLSNLPYLCWRKPMKGATPVPGPTIIKGTDRSEGGRKEQLGLKLTWIWGQRTLASI